MALQQVESPEASQGAPNVPALSPESSNDTAASARADASVIPFPESVTSDTAAAENVPYEPWLAEDEAGPSSMLSPKKLRNENGDAVCPFLYSVN